MIERIEAVELNGSELEVFKTKLEIKGDINHINTNFKKFDDVNDIKMGVFFKYIGSYDYAYNMNEGKYIFSRVKMGSERENARAYIDSRFQSVFVVRANEWIEFEKNNYVAKLPYGIIKKSVEESLDSYIKTKIKSK